MLGETRFQAGLIALPSYGADRFQSILDWLFCRLHPSFAEACQDYYRAQGPRLAEDPRASAEAIALWDRRLCVLIEAATSAHAAKERLEWDFARLYVDHETVGPAILN